MPDAASVPPVRRAMVHRLSGRLRGAVEEDSTTLESRLYGLDDWALATLLRVTRAESGGNTSPRRSGHLGVVGVDYALNQLVVGEPRARVIPSQVLDAVDLDALDDEDLIAASHYVPETLPGYLLG